MALYLQQTKCKRVLIVTLYLSENETICTLTELRCVNHYRLEIATLSSSPVTLRRQQQVHHHSHHSITVHYYKLTSKETPQRPCLTFFFQYFIQFVTVY